MQTNRTMFSPRSSTSESSRQREVEEIVEGLIAKRGYHSVINELMIALHNLAEISLADPLNQTTEREFKIWARGVQIAIRRHSEKPWESKHPNSLPRSRGHLQRRYCPGVLHFSVPTSLRRPRVDSDHHVQIPLTA
jgi:hypothetical protein